jgi:hypothetical protein
MRLFYQSPQPQRPMPRPVPSIYRTTSNTNTFQRQYQNHVPSPYGQFAHYYEHHVPSPQYYDRPYQNNFPPPFHYARTPPPLPPPPIERIRTPPPPDVIFIHPNSPSKPSRKAQRPTTDLIYEVRDSDVLCGRGAPSQYQTGNKFFRDVVERFQSSYIAARRIDKPEIATHIVDLVRERGGRFLKRTKVQGVGPSGHFCWYVHVWLSVTIYLQEVSINFFSQT